MLFIAIIFILLLFYKYRSNYTYWEKRNVKHDPTLPLFGNHFSILCGKRTETEKYVELYNKYKYERFVGYYRGKRPELLIRDPELAKHMFNLDFLNFHQRGLGRDPKVEPLMLNLFSTEGDNWRLLRHELSPAFTGSKLRSMFPLVKQCADKLQQVATALSEKDEVIDACDLMARFSVDFIGACGFGLDMNAISTEKSLFVELRHTIFTKTYWQMLIYALRDLFPDWKFINNVPIANSCIQKTILDIVQIIRSQRCGNPEQRNDFMDILLELETKGKISGESLKEKDQNGLAKEVEIAFDDKYLAAQLFIYFAAGFETSSTATSFTLHMLAYHPDIQLKVQEEIDSVLDKNGGKLSYDGMSEFSLLEMAFKESMRIFPPGGNTTRICTKEYTIPGTDITIEPGVKVIFPIQGYQMDPKYFEDPTEFRPERFSPGAVKNRHKFVYIPFGEGPRKCIGARLGLLESLAGLVAILQKFTVEPAPTSKRHHRVDRTSYLVQMVEGGLPIRLKLRENRPSLS